jgi:hypothetical protein
MAEILDKDGVKAAIRELMDDLSVTYAHGAGIFFDKVMRSMADMVDAFDEFYTTNLMKDRPRAASAFVELRLRAVRTAERTLSTKIAELERFDSRIKRELRAERTRVRAMRARRRK